jgi:hypothetical protein
MMNADFPLYTKKVLKEIREQMRQANKWQVVVDISLS